MENNISFRDLIEKKSELSKHPVYSRLNSKMNIKIFMEFHVFAVWDFMSLLKRLQREITCVQVPWTPSKYPKNIVRMINEIVLAEESDLDNQGKACDHFSLYIRSMEEVGADLSSIKAFLKDFDLNKLKPGIREFVSFNLKLSKVGELHQVASAFFYGREDVIPDMFKSMVHFLRSSDMACPSLLYYLERHIEVDEGEHSLLAKKCMDFFCEDNPDKWIDTLKWGHHSLILRQNLWDSAQKEIDAKNRSFENLEFF